MAYEGGMGYQLHMPSYFWRTFTEYPFENIIKVAFSYDIVIRLFRVVEIIVSAELNDWLVNT